MSKDTDIVEFVEKYWGVELLECQKDMLRKYYSTGPDVRLVFPRYMGRTDFRLLAKMAEAYFEGVKNESTKDKLDSV